MQSGPGCHVIDTSSISKVLENAWTLRAEIQYGLRRDSEEERRPLPRLALEPDAAVMPLQDLLDDSKTDACSRILLLSMQTLEHLEQLVGVLGVDAYAVVLDREDPIASLAAGRNIDSQWLGSTELDRVAEQVLEHQSNLLLVGHGDGR